MALASPPHVFEVSGHRLAFLVHQDLSVLWDVDAQGRIDEGLLQNAVHGEAVAKFAQQLRILEVHQLVLLRESGDGVAQLLQLVNVLCTFVYYTVPVGYDNRRRR